MPSKWGGRRVTELRAEFRSRMLAGHAYICPFCRRPIAPGQPWDLDHRLPQALDAGGSRTWDGANLRPAHRSCNRAAGARLGNKMHPRKRRRRRRPAAPFVLVGGAPEPVPQPPVPVPRPRPFCAGCGEVLAVAEDWVCDGCAEVVAGDG